MNLERVSASTTRLVRERSRALCEYCRSPERVSPDPFSVEHIVPRVAGGTSQPDNLALSCQGCNNGKGIKTQALDPQTGLVVPLFHPRLHDWSAHFEWSVNSLQIVGRTPTGRATVIALRLNRPNVQNLRQLLRDANQHPPIF